MRGSENRDLYNLNDDIEIKPHVFKERIAGLRRPDLIKLNRISPETDHKVIFVIKQRNLEELKRILHDVSDPSSINYGKHKTRQEVADLTANLISRDYLVSYLTSVGATDLSETLDGEYVTANAPIRLWEEMFHTEFFMFHQTQDLDRIKKFVRAEHYYIPVSLDAHVESVFNTVQMPIEMFGIPIILPEPIHDVDNKNNKKETQGGVFFSGMITPDKLKVRSNGHY
jgi:subtilase family serine protease